MTPTREPHRTLMESLAIRRLLVPTDFSEEASTAFPLAAAIAARFGARVRLLHASPVARFDPDLLGTLAPDFVEEEDPLSLFALEGTRAAHFAAVETSLRIVPGEPAKVILAEAASWFADLIVIGTHGRGHARHALLGSVAAAVASRGNLPVLTVRRRPFAPQPAQIAQILCPIEPGGAAMQALHHAAFLAAAFDAELLAVRLREGEGDPVEMSLPAGRVPIRLLSLGHRGDPQARLSEVARSQRVDLVVAGAEARGHGLATTIGPMTASLIRHLPCPVLTVPCDAAGAAMHVEDAELAAAGGTR